MSALDISGNPEVEKLPGDINYLLWNTVYMAKVIKYLKGKGFEISDEDVSHLSPCRYDHINKYGYYKFNVEEFAKKMELRPLRISSEA